MEGYYKISRHYKWALEQVFDVYNYKLAIIIEGISHEETPLIRTPFTKGSIERLFLIVMSFF